MSAHIGIEIKYHTKLSLNDDIENKIEINKKKTNKHIELLNIFGVIYWDIYLDWLINDFRCDC